MNSTDVRISHLPASRIGPIAAVLASMSSVQLGAAISIGLFGTFGAIGTTWLRLSLASLVLLLIARPWRGRRDGLGAAVGLGVVTAGMMASFSLATDRIPLGVAVAVEFCGPLAVGAFGSRGGPGRLSLLGRSTWLLWPALAAAGVLLLTHPWSEGLGADGSTSSQTWIGLGFAFLAAAGWGCYILLTAHVGRRTTGLGGLSVSLATASLLLLPVGIVQAAPTLGHLASHPLDDLGTVGLMLLAALLSPLVAYGLEMGALRNVDARVFGVWMSLEPAIGATVGFLFLSQGLNVLALLGIALVTAAGAGAQSATSPDVPQGAGVDEAIGDDAHEAERDQDLQEDQHGQGDQHGRDQPTGKAVGDRAAPEEARAALVGRKGDR